MSEFYEHGKRLRNVYFEKQDERQRLHKNKKQRQSIGRREKNLEGDAGKYFQVFCLNGQSKDFLLFYFSVLFQNCKYGVLTFVRHAYI